MRKGLIKQKLKIILKLLRSGALRNTSTAFYCTTVCLWAVQCLGNDNAWEWTSETDRPQSLSTQLRASGQQWQRWYQATLQEAVMTTEILHDHNETVGKEQLTLSCVSNTTSLELYGITS